MKNFLLNKKLPLTILILAVVFFVMSMAGSHSEDGTERMAKKTEQRISKRIRILDQHIQRALITDLDRPIKPEGLPEDMVIYRYVNDSLQSWVNQFPIINDDISSRLVFERLLNFKSRLISPLTRSSGTFSYMNLGPKWFIIKSVQGNSNDKIIAGIEIKNTLIDDISKSENGVNRRLRLPDQYTVLPLNHSGGIPVTVDGKALFKIIHDTGSAMPFFDNSLLRWTSLILLVAAMIMFLAGHRTFRTFAAVTLTLTILCFMSYMWGTQMSGNSSLFSPSLYANGTFFFSLGALIIINTYITLMNICSYLINGRIMSAIRKDRRRRRRRMILFGCASLILTAGIAIYTHLTLKSLIFNSSITLEIHRMDGNIFHAVLVYLSYSGLLFCMLLQMQNLRPVARELTGIRYDIFSMKTLMAFSLLCAVYFSITAEVYGFQKEQKRISVWANMLAVERDLGIEIQLRSVEDGIASDQLISALSLIENTQGMVTSRIRESYLPRLSQDYEIHVTFVRDYDNAARAYLNDVIHNGSQIAEGSRFMFMIDESGHGKYAGLFLYYSSEFGLTQMLMEIEMNTNREDRGYYSIMGRFSKPGGIDIPTFYSYAKYIEGRLISFNGSYPYPTVFNYQDKEDLLDGKDGIYRVGKHTHFLNMVSDEELIMISRPQRNGMMIFTSMSYLFIGQMGILSLFARSRKKKAAFKSNYFRTRINTILFLSSFLILASITTVSVIFVYKRNKVNMMTLMSSKISTVQALVEVNTRNARNSEDLMTQEFNSALENISNTNKTDITLYTPSGKVFCSTTPEVFEKMMIGSRIDEDAFYSIVHENQRFFMHREKIADYSYWALYAPIFNSRQDLIAIACVPYTDSNYDFKREAVFHASLIINLFILLLIAVLLFCTREVNSMFTPLVEMGKKMNAADIHNLEYIIYKREDEISSLVDAYNRMVKDLSDSTRRLAQAERDKAWSQMARQVAHEIKNPLTPIKLEIQRLIRLKQNNNPKWEEKFDKVSSVVLEHIDILTDTANEFSTFAKLYSEDPVLLDLDKTLKDQLLIFDNRENVSISYIGMENAFVMAPKPQLIRVFVNLITNGLQAVEIMQREAVESGAEPPQGKLFISLRNSTRDGCYDIVFDDNGPGVKEENLSKLFTPNFTTKSGGTGLGLAICRKIMEKCEGEIGYQKSFALGGASFCVTIPKYREEA